MFAQLNDRQTSMLMFIALMCVTFIIIKVIDALDKRGERAHERFINIREQEVTVRVSDDALPSVGILDKHAAHIRSAGDHTGKP